MHPKAKLFAVKFRRILDVLYLQVLQKRFWAQFHDLCVQKLSCLRWSSDAFWKFSACKVYRKSFGRNSTICVSKNEAVYCEVQTDFKSSLPVSFTDKVVGAILQFVCPKTKLFAVKFRRILEVLCLQVLKKVLDAIPWFLRPKMMLFVVKFRRILEVLCLQVWSKSSGRNSTICMSKNKAVCPEIQMHFGSSLPASFAESSGCNSMICASKNETVCCEIEMHFRSSLPPRFTEKFLDKFLRFMCPKTKLFAVKFRPILQALPLARLIKKLWAHFHGLCVVQTNILDFNVL